MGPVQKDPSYLNQIRCHHSGTSGAPGLTMHVDTLAQRLVLESELNSFPEVSQGWDSSHVYCAESQLLNSYFPPLLKPGPPAETEGNSQVSVVRRWAPQGSRATRKPQGLFLQCGYTVYCFLNKQLFIEIFIFFVCVCFRNIF